MEYNTQDNEIHTGTDMEHNFGTDNVLQEDDWFNQYEDEPYVVREIKPKKTRLNENAKESKKIFISTKDKLILILGILMFGTLNLLLLSSGMDALFVAPRHPMEEAFTILKRNEVYEGTITWISPEFVEITHVFAFFPVSKEHFYLTLSEDQTTMIPVRASKKWEKLYSTGKWEKVSIEEKAIVREMNDDVKKTMNLAVSPFYTEQGIKVETEYYLDLNVNRIGRLEILSPMLFFGCIIWLILFGKHFDEEGKFGKVVRGVTYGAALVGMMSFFYISAMTSTSTGKHEWTEVNTLFQEESRGGFDI